MWQQFPQLVPTLLVVDQVHPDVDAEPLIQPLYQQARERLNRSSEAQMPEIAAWRRAYSEMGLKPTKYRSAAEALLRRFKREDDLPRLHPLVDFCNAVSLAFALPIAVFDVTKIDSYLEVRHATGSEQYLAFNGDTEQPPVDEVIFADASNQVHARRWTFRQSLQSTISAETSEALIVSEALHDKAQTDIQALTESLVLGLTKLYDPPRRQAFLTADSPKFEF